MRILVVEDEEPMAAAVAAAVRHEGHAVDVVHTGDDALTWANTYPYDLVLLDVVLPGRDGFAVCAALRNAGYQTPILMLTALDEIDHRVTGLDRGADDYLAKPFAMAELLARTRALLRRRSSDRSPVLRVGDLEIDPSAHAVHRAGRAIQLTAREFAVLELLARNQGQLFSRDRLLSALWDAGSEPASNIIEVYVRSLRRKVDDGARESLIETVRGVGYRLRDIDAE